jgi:hypothetical protein
MVSAYNMIVEEPEEERNRGRPRPRRRDNMKMDVKKQGVTAWTEVAQNRVQGWGFTESGERSVQIG